MEHLNWMAIDPEYNIINLSSVDAMAIIPFIRGRDFQIVKMWGFKVN